MKELKIKKNRQRIERVAHTVFGIWLNTSSKCLLYFTPLIIFLLLV